MSPAFRFLCEQRKKLDKSTHSNSGTRFNPLPLRTKEETAALKTRKNVWKKGLIAFSRHNNCEPVCAMLINTKRNHSIAKRSVYVWVRKSRIKSGETGSQKRFIIE